MPVATVEGWKGLPAGVREPFTWIPTLRYTCVSFLDEACSGQSCFSQQIIVTGVTVTRVTKNLSLHYTIH